MNWNSSILWGIIGVVCTIFFGFIFGYIFYRKGLKRKRLICYCHSTTLISENISNYKKLKILYNDTEIQTLNSTLINFKNVGNDIIEPTDIVPSDPIIINTSGNFLSFTEDTLFKIEVTNPKVKVSLEYLDTANLKLIFDFLPPKCKISVTVLHNGDISIFGDLKVGLFKQVINSYSYEDDKYDISIMDKTMIKFTSLILKVLYLFSFTLLIIPPMEMAFRDPTIYNKDTASILLLFPISGIFLLFYHIFFEKKFFSDYKINDKSPEDD